MQKNITINLPSKIRSAMDEVTKEDGISVDELIREAITEYLFFHRLRSLRERMIAKAQSQGVYTDQDVFERVS